MEKYSVALSSIVEELKLEKIYVPENFEQIMVYKKEVNRPGLQLAGFFDHYDNERIQIMGKVEYHYLLDMTSQERQKRLDDFFGKGVTALVISSNLEVFPEVVSSAEKYVVPVLRSADTTSNIMGALIASLNVSLAERMTRHGVFVECYGEGILILGDSGIGKSEAAIELVKRGHRLIADDAVEIKKVSAKTLVGSAPELIRHYIELRGIGIVDVRRIFGMGSVKLTEKIDMIINLELWQQGKFYERVGMDTEYTNIMGIDIPTTTIPVRPGRNLAVVIEIAAMNNRQKKMGYNTAVEFNKKLMGQLSDDSDR
ncbi:MAG: HPr(Ser) kinase/phosphatase [Clostridia bacterium]|nr:HPr(Ser) kinase/phosphatase [Clostridia bacterium]